MKTTLRIMIATAILALAAAAGTARADYHPACLGVVTGNDSMTMGVTAPTGDGDDDAGFVSYSGQVTCPGAERVEIDLELTGPSASTAHGECIDVVDCIVSTSAGDTVALADGDYTLSMSFHVESIGAAMTFDPPARCGVWTVADTGAEDGPTITGPVACPTEG